MFFIKHIYTYIYIYTNDYTNDIREPAQQSHDEIQLDIASSCLAVETTMPALDIVVGPNAAEEDGPMTEA